MRGETVGATLLAPIIPRIGELRSLAPVGGGALTLAGVLATARTAP